jgi:nicotinamidase-related amidase
LQELKTAGIMITAIDKITALVLIDLQKGVVNMDTAHPAKDVVANAVKLINAFRKEKLPVVLVNVNPMGASWTKTRKEVSMVPKNAVMQSLAIGAMQITGFDDIVADIIRQANDILITKKTWNAFFNTNLNDELQKRNVTGIVIAGISTSIGVEGTARAASELGFNISFATDGMTDRLLAAHNNSIQNIFPRMGELGTTEEILSQLESRK